MRPSHRTNDRDSYGRFTMDDSRSVANDQFLSGLYLAIGKLVQRFDLLDRETIEFL